MKATLGKYNPKQDKERERRKEEELERERELQKQKQKKALQDSYNEMLNNLMSTNIVKPTNVEAQRILNILDILVKDIEILSFVDTDFLFNFLDLVSTKLPRDQMEKISPKTLELMKNQSKIEFLFHELTKPEEVGKYDLFFYFKLKLMVLKRCEGKEGKRRR